MTPEETHLEAELKKTALAPRLTPEDIDGAIASAAYFVFPGTTVTVCCLTLRNGFNVVGQSACASLENFNARIGEHLAFEDARRQVWRLEGYWLKGLLAMTDEAEAIAQARRVEPYLPPEWPGDDLVAAEAKADARLIIVS